jgi:hypothetical protein
LAQTIADLLGVDTLPISTIPRWQGRPSWFPGPPQFAFAQVGALFCEYNGGLHPHATLMIVPDVGDYADVDPDVELDPPSVRCKDGEFGALCSARGLFGETYVELFVNPVPSVGADDRFAAAFAAVAERAAPIRPRTEEVAKGRACEAVLPAGVLSDLAGTDYEITRPVDGPISMESWLSFEVLGANPCYYWKDTGEGDLGGLWHGVLTQLPDGEWAYRETVDGISLDVSEGAEAVLSCEPPPYQECAVDVLRGDDWLRYRAFGSSSTTDPAMIVLATEIASLLAR